jgi:hypothetical protein
VKNALELFSGRGVKIAAALTLARIASVREARTLMEKLEKSYPSNALLKVYWLPSIRTSIGIERANASQAIANLEPRCLTIGADREACTRHICAGERT